MSKVYKIGTGKRVYAIGDIHGYPDVLARLHDKIDADLVKRPVEQAKIIYLGDYIDRGPDSKGVIDVILNRRDARDDIEHVCLLGNHEDAMFHEFLNDPEGHRQDWLQWGGVEAAQSYGVRVDEDISLVEQAVQIAEDLRQAIPTHHKEFYENLDLYHVVDDYLFVHAGLMPDVALDKQVKTDLTYTREPFMSFDGAHPYRVVHGHTSTKDRKVDIRHNRINVDTGLYMDGPLACAVIEGADVRVIEVR